MRRLLNSYLSMLLVVLVMLSVSGLFRSACAFDQCGDSTAKPSFSVESSHHIDQKHCPSCPTHHGDSSEGDDCSCHCDCPCNAPLITVALAISCQQPVSELSVFELFQAIPEVYLPTAVPPHILA